MSIDRQIVENEQVVNAWTFTGSHCGDFMGIAPTGNLVTFTGITIYDTVGGKIAEERSGSDVFGLMQQLGAGPDPAQPSE